MIIITRKILEKIISDCQIHTTFGKVASYIPELKKANPTQLGVCIADNNKNLYQAGDTKVKFSIQSVSKILIFTCALIDSGIDKVMQVVSVEPTNDPFNSISSLETKNHNKPLNPMINAGAIACLGLVSGNTAQEKFQRILSFACSVSGNAGLNIEKNIYESEKSTASRNRALAYYMKSSGVIVGDVEEILDTYFRVCSIYVDCIDLAKIGLLYANNGVDLPNNHQFFSREIAQMVKATMSMCGMYNESGQIAVRIGLPTKSGVGGGIISVVPGRMGIGIFGPALNVEGSSIAGIAVLEALSKQLDLSIY